MVKFEPDKTVRTYEEIMEKYKGYIALVIEKTNNSGVVYAYSDFDGLTELTDIQYELEDKGQITYKVRNLGQNNNSLSSGGGLL